ncbi:hypothetical protein O181_015801 [Austropuccinia psidii MF-1]|uniref:Retrovirus-related Pol polyprotein from transposon TNT 1-94-like beta-barrel domain-containing protein n=1 Tax=Austropuccinia psidii MF-1 TaxID=1389203 RepID=A0A9Q3C0J4_9BASI|nr:hypothetical protein [Austropuccinia psidii MF-1]
MDWIRSNYHANLQDSINIFRKMKIELYAVNINIEAKLLLLSILANLLHKFVNNLCIQPEKINSTSSALTTSAHPYKITHYCANGKHNPNCTSHSKDQCFSKNPKLRLERRKNQRRFPSNIPPLAHISSAQASFLVTGSSNSLSSIKLIIDCGATHQIFNTKTLFSTLDNIPPLRISTGDSSSSLVAEGMGTVNLPCKYSTLTLKNCLYVPKLNCNLMSLLKLFQDKITITRKEDPFSLNSKNTLFLKGRILSNLFIFSHSSPASLLTKTRDSLWHNFLGNPGDVLLKYMGLPTNSSSFQACSINKAHQLPFDNQFNLVNNPSDCVHIDLVGPISCLSVSGF